MSCLQKKGSVSSPLTTTTTTTTNIQEDLVPPSNLQILHGWTVKAPGITRSGHSSPLSDRSSPSSPLDVSSSSDDSPSSSLDVYSSPEDELKADVYYTKSGGKWTHFDETSEVKLFEVVSTAGGSCVVFTSEGDTTEVEIRCKEEKLRLSMILGNGRKRLTVVEESSEKPVDFITEEKEKQLNESLFSTKRTKWVWDVEMEDPPTTFTTEKGSVIEIIKNKKSGVLHISVMNEQNDEVDDIDIVLEKGSMTFNGNSVRGLYDVDPVDISDSESGEFDERSNKESGKSPKSSWDEESSESNEELYEEPKK